MHLCPSKIKNIAKGMKWKDQVFGVHFWSGVGEVAHRMERNMFGLVDWTEKSTPPVLSSHLCSCQVEQWCAEECGCDTSLPLTWMPARFGAFNGLQESFQLSKIVSTFNEALEGKLGPYISSKTLCCQNVLWHFRTRYHFTCCLIASVVTISWPNMIAHILWLHENNRRGQ